MLFVTIIVVINGEQKISIVSFAELSRNRLLLCRQQTHHVASMPFSNTLKKLTLRKYDPLVNQHVLFHEVKMPSGKKRT